LSTHTTTTIRYTLTPGTLSPEPDLWNIYSLSSSFRWMIYIWRLLLNYFLLTVRNAFYPCTYRKKYDAMLVMRYTQLQMYSWRNIIHPDKKAIALAARHNDTNSFCATRSQPLTNETATHCGTFAMRPAILYKWLCLLQLVVVLSLLTFNITLQQSIDVIYNLHFVTFEDLITKWMDIIHWHQIELLQPTSKL
jgi:hypothetical protein